MAYYFPAGYPQYNPYQVQPLQQAQQPQQPGGFIPVRSEDEARNYPVAPGNSVAFRSETEPYVYTKSMGVSPFDRPVFDKYRLVKEDTENKPGIGPNSASSVGGADLSEYAKKAELEALRAEFEALNAELVKRSTRQAKKGDMTDD